jgi:hypothetical protein
MCTWNLVTRATFFVLWVMPGRIDVPASFPPHKLAGVD